MRGTENLFSRLLSLMSAKVSTTFIAIISTPIIVRLLGPSGYGDYAVLLSVFSLYMIPISGTVTEGVQKFVGEDREEGWTEAVVRFYVLLGLGVVLVGAAVLLGVTVAGIPSAVFGQPFDLYFLLLVVFVLTSQVQVLGSHTVLGLGLEHLSGPLSIVKKFTTVSLGIALVLSGYGVVGMLAGHVAANVLVAVLAAVIVLRRLSPGVFVKSRSLPYREMLSFNVVNIGLVLLSMSLYHVDLVMLRVLTTSETTGFYKAAITMAEYLWFVPIVVQRLLLHSTSNLWADDRITAISDLASRVTRHILLFVVLLAVGLATLADRVMVLYYGPEFVVSTIPLLILLPGTIAFGAARPLKAIGQGSGRVKVLLVAMGAAATINVVLNALLIPRFAMLGAAVATSVGYASMLVFTVLAARRIGFNPVTDLRLARITVTAGVTAVPVLLLDHLITSDALALAVVPPVGGIVYFVTALATGALDGEEIAPVLEYLPSPIDDVLLTGVALVDRH